MDITARIRLEAHKIIQEIYQISLDADQIQINETKPEFEGDYTVVLFPFVKNLKKKPEDLGNEIGRELIVRNPDFVGGFNVIKGFLNLSILEGVWIDFLKSAYNDNSFGSKAGLGKKVMVEYSSPNTNKPLHLGHLRNNFLGWTIASIHHVSGYETVKSCIANDRGIHICKSMIAWQMFGNGATPQSTGIKGDHLVGDYYVLFGEIYKQQIKQLISDGMSEDEAEKEAPLMKAAQQMLIDWEAGKPEVIALWKRMNGSE